MVPSKTKIAYHFSTLVLVNGQQHTLQIEPRDEYGNPTSNSTSLVDEVNYSVHIHSVRHRPPAPSMSNPTPVVYPYPTCDTAASEHACVALV